LGSSFHCSVIGTCLTTAELRQILLKIELPGVDKALGKAIASKHAGASLRIAEGDTAAQLIAELSRLASAR